MNKYLTFIFFLIILSGCTKETIISESNCYFDSNPPRNNHKVIIKQGVWGDVWFWSGDFMPVGRGKICQVERKVMVFESTKLADVVQNGFSAFYTEVNTKLVKTIISDKDGFFQLDLQPGNYSLFIMEEDMYYANSFGSGGIIFPINIESEKVTEVRFDITYNATF